MTSRIISIIKFLLLLSVAFTLLFFAFRGITVKAILIKISQADIWWLLLSTLVSIAALVSRAYRWNLLIEPLGYKPRLENTFYAVTIGYLANLAFPRLGEVSRCGVLNRTESVPFNMLLGTVIVERAIDVATLILCFILTAIIEFNRLGKYLTETIINPLVAKIKDAVSSPLLVTSVLAFVIAILLLLGYFMNKSRQGQKESRISQFINGLLIGLKSLGKLQRPWLFVLHSFLIWFLYFLSMYLCFFSMPATRGLGSTAALFLLVAGGLGMSAPVQGGIGAYHLLVSQGLVLFGLSKQDGLAFATLVHAAQIFMTIVFGSTSLLLLFFRAKRS